MTTDLTTAAPGAVILASDIPLVGMEDYMGTEFRLPRLNIIQTMEQMSEFDGKPGEIHNSLTAENVSALDVTVLASKKNRWLGPDYQAAQAMRDKGQEVKAYCKSSDGNVPDADVEQPKCSACKICPLGAPKRAAEGGWEPAACTEIRKVLVKLPDGSVAMLTVRNKAVREVDAFVQRFYMQRKNLFTVRAALSTKAEKGKLNTYYLPQLAPRYDQPVPDEEQLDLFHTIGLYADFFAAQSADTAGEENAAPDASAGGAIDVQATSAPAPIVNTPPAPPPGQMPSVDEAGF
jgi:hypothetical protein